MDALQRMRMTKKTKNFIDLIDKRALKIKVRGRVNKNLKIFV